MQIRGLYKRYSITGEYSWHIDKRIRRVGRLCENTGTADREEAERYLQRRTSELREIAVFGVRPRRTFREATAKYLADFASKSTIRRDAEALSDLDPYIGRLCLDQINNDSFATYRNARQHLSIITRNAKIGVARRILKLAATVWCYPKTNMTWLDRAPIILLEQRHRAREPYPLDASEQELLFSELTLTGSNRRHSPCKGGQGSGPDFVGLLVDCNSLILRMLKTRVGRPLQTSIPGEHEKALVGPAKIPRKCSCAFCGTQILLSDRLLREGPARREATLRQSRGAATDLGGRVCADKANHDLINTPTFIARYALSDDQSVQNALRAKPDGFFSRTLVQKQSRIGAVSAHPLPPCHLAAPYTGHAIIGPPPSIERIEFARQFADGPTAFPPLGSPANL
jgi:hypothetical protein